MLKNHHKVRSAFSRNRGRTLLRESLVFMGVLLVLPFSLPCYSQDAEQPVPPDEIRYESSVGAVLFPHKLHLKMKCKRCHHQIHAEELRTPHEDYLDSSWINCRTCHDGELVTGNDGYRCSGCHHSEPQNIADETLSSKVVVHKSCWKCHKTGTGVKASQGCADCHVKDEKKSESPRETASP